ncbi:16941_t:CDS:1, partial [Funneliformis caledonium]
LTEEVFQSIVNSLTLMRIKSLSILGEEVYGSALLFQKNWSVSRIFGDRNQEDSARKGL